MANTKSAASKRDGLKDLTPKNPRQVKGERKPRFLAPFVLSTEASLSSP